MDNIITLSNRVHWGFAKRMFTIAAFLDIAGAFDNVIPSILFEDLREIGLPAKICKFVANLLSKRQIYSINNSINTWSSPNPVNLPRRNSSGIHF